MADEVIAAEPAPAPVGRKRKRRVAKWAGGILLAILLALVGAALVLDSPLGERFIASRIAARTFPNGLNISIGRIEGNIYGAAILHDVKLSDPKGVFMTIPRAEVDWNPRGWLRNRLDIDSFAARRGELLRIPEFLPSTEDKPILPGFDIAIGRFDIDNLMIAPGIAGDRAQRVDLTGKALVEDRRMNVEAAGQLGRADRVRLVLDAEPDGDRFDLAFDLVAKKDGPLAALAGLKRGYSAAIRGKGGWRNWQGGLLARSGDKRVAALRIANRQGRISLLGRVDPSDFTSGILARALGSNVAIKADISGAERVFRNQAVVLGSGALLRTSGTIDLAQNRAENQSVTLVGTDPRLFGPDQKVEGLAAQLRLDGPFKAMAIVHDAKIRRLTLGEIAIENLRQRGTAQLASGRLTVPLALTAGRVRSGNSWLDPRLVDGSGRGRLVFKGANLTGEDLRIAFRGLTADLALRGNLVRGDYRLAGPVRAEGLRLDNVGTARGTAMVELVLAKGVPWRVAAKLDARIAPVSNATLANLAGPSLRLRGGIAAGGKAPLVFRNLTVDAAKLRLALNGQVRQGTTSLAGRGTHSDYGPFTVEARLAGGKPDAVLVFAKPTGWLDNVRLAIAPEGDGFAIGASGGSTLGPFTGAFGLTAPKGRAAQVTIRQLRVSDTDITGALSLEDGGARGQLSLAGGGLNGTIGLVPQQGGQGLAVDLVARQARFGGDTPLTIARAEVRGTGLLRKGHTSFTGQGTAQGLSYGSLFIGRLAAKGAIEDGRGRIDASLSGRRGSRFDLDLNALVRPDGFGIAARGEYAGKPISTPRRVQLTRLDEGGWQLAPAHLVYGDGGVVAAGRFGAGESNFEFKLAKMPLSLLDIVNTNIGLGGTVSGVVEYRKARLGLPQGSARVKVDDLTRSGLTLTSKPIDLSLLARLDADSLDAEARLSSSEIRRGRLSANITGLPADGPLDQRLRAGRLAARLSFNGAAESLWRLAAVDAFDLTGPVAISAEATGSLANPLVRGAVSSDNLRLTSAIAGTDIREAKLRGRFDGSQLRILQLIGKSGIGTVSGSGTIDLAGIGERVVGSFVEIRAPSLDLRIAANNARLLDAAGIGATVTGPLRIVSDGLGGTIAGRVRVNRANWRLGTAAEDERLPRIATREINVPADRAPSAAAGRPWRYLIDATAPNRIDVEGMGLDSEWSADIRLRGTTEDPRVGGRARMVKGDYTFAGTSFELTRGEIAFDQGVPIDPRLDIRAESSVPGLKVEVRVTGVASAPEIAFTSDPSLPEEEILARLLFGGSITTLSATDALQLGAALASLRGGAGIDPINRLRSAIGLDRLRIVSADPVLGRGTGVAIGKNITRRIYVELVTDGKGYSATDLEFRVTSWLSLLASISTVGRESAVVEISRDY